MHYQRLPDWKSVGELSSLLDLHSPPKELFYSGRFTPQLFPRCVAVIGSRRMTDVWTSAGVVGGILLVAVTGWHRLDPIVALGVACNIVWTGGQIIRRSVLGLMDTALPGDEILIVTDILDSFARQGISFHGIRSRQSGSRRFVSFHVLVPGSWTVKKGHTHLENIERAIRKALPKTTVFTHLEPNNDPRSYRDVTLDR